jgi:long-chain acyl-CoA synthetase
MSCRNRIGYYFPVENPWDRRLGFWHIAEDRPDYPAILHSPDGPRSYAELAGEAHQLAHLFRSLGAEQGDPVGIVADNGNTLIEVSLACNESGLLFIPLNVHLTPSELAAIIEHSGAKVLVVGERFADLLADLDHADPDLTILSIGTIDGVQSLADARRAHPTTEPPNRTPGGLFVYTSGTTGKPKGIRRAVPDGDVGEVASTSTIFARAFDFRPFEGPMLVSTGMFHGGSHSYYLGGLHVGHSLVIMAKFDADEALQLIQRFRVTSGYMVPTQFHRLLQLPEDTRKEYDVTSLHSIVHSAAPCPLPVKQRMMDWWGPVIWETYGGMEGAATIAKPHRWLEKPGTVGRTVRGVEIFIVDDDGNDLPRGEVGHIYMENTVGFEYHDDPEQTKSAFRGNRFSLGDIGHLDADGYLFITDRAKDMIITGGTNVYPAEVEAVLLENPLVGDVAVIGIPDDDWGETVVAVVQPAKGVEPGDDLADQLKAFAAERLASYKRPRRWDFRIELPRSEAGKLYKRTIRDQYVADANASTEGLPR